MGFAIYTPSETVIREYFGVSQDVAALRLSLYVLAYGMGPLSFSPLSEIPAISRNWPYIVTMVIFVIICVPTAVVDRSSGKRGHLHTNYMRVVCTVADRMK